MGLLWATLRLHLTLPALQIDFRRRCKARMCFSKMACQFSTNCQWDNTLFLYGLGMPVILVFTQGFPWFMQSFASRKFNATWKLWGSQKLLRCCVWVWKMENLLASDECELLALDVSQMVRVSGCHHTFLGFKFLFTKKKNPSVWSYTLSFVFSQLYWAIIDLH